MFTLYNKNNDWYRVDEPYISFKSNKAVVKVLSWPSEAEMLSNADTVTLSMFVMPFTTWQPDTLHAEANNRFAQWVPYDFDSIESLLAPPLTLEELKINKSNEISGACQTEIFSGFISDALGSNHLYPSNDKDQVNLSGSILRSTLASASPSDVYPFLCMDGSNVWLYRDHTAAQLQEVGSDSYDFILGLRQQNGMLQYAISIATTKEQVAAIVW
jgi:hypothetical protein